MQRKFLSVFALSLIALVVVPCFADERSPLLSQGDIQRFGLTRSWFNQIHVDINTTHVQHVLLDRGTLFIVTSDSRLLAIDAESGQALWNRSVGQPGYGTFQPAANSRVVGAINGADIYIFDRRNGRLIWQKGLPAAPTAACQITDFYVYTPLVDSRMSCFPLEEQLAPSEELLKLVPMYAELGYVLDPFTGKVTANKVLLGPERLAAEKTKELLDAALKKEEERLFELKEGLTEAEKDKVQALEGSLIEDAENVNKPYYLKSVSLPMTCYSFGMCTRQPVVCSESTNLEYVSWFTDRGFLFISRGKRQGEPRFELQHKLMVSPLVSYLRTSKIGKREGNIARDIEFTPSVVQRDPDNTDSKFLVVVGTSSGLVIAYNPKSAVDVWCHSIGSPITARTVVVKDHVYVPCFDGNMHCLNTVDGKPIWTASGVKDFIAASPSRVYARNYFDELIAIDPNSGAQTTLFSLRPYETTYLNAENDRIYLVTKNGLVQCLHEIGQTTPVRHVFAPEAYIVKEESQTETKKAKAQVTSTPEVTEAQPVDVTPFETGNTELGADPFNTPAQVDAPTKSNVTTPQPASTETPATPPSTSDDPFDF